MFFLQLQAKTFSVDTDRHKWSGLAGDGVRAKQATSSVVTQRYLPVSVHVQLVAQQDDGSLRPESFVVQGQCLQVQLAAFEALQVVNAVDHEKGVGP